MAEPIGDFTFEKIFRGSEVRGNFQTAMNIVAKLVEQHSISIDEIIQ
jgi:hypothetical protein